MSHILTKNNISSKFHLNLTKQNQIWTNSGLTHGYAQAGMGKHVTKLTNINSFHINNISFKFH